MVSQAEKGGDFRTHTKCSSPDTRTLPMYTSISAKAKAATNCLFARTLPTLLPFVLQRLDFVTLSVVQYQRHLQISRIKPGGVSPCPTLGCASCSNFAIAKYSRLVDSFMCLRFDVRDFVCKVDSGAMPPSTF